MQRQINGQMNAANCFKFPANILAKNIGDKKDFCSIVVSRDDGFYVP